MISTERTIPCLNPVSGPRIAGFPLEDDAFDRVTRPWVIHLFPDPAAALREIRRVLHPDGALAGTTVVDRYLFRIPGVG